MPPNRLFSIPSYKLFPALSNPYKELSFKQLLRGYGVLKLCTIPAFARNSEKFYRLGQSLIGRRATNLILRHTFYGHFVAGDKFHELATVSGKLNEKNVKLMLLPPMEDIHGQSVDFTDAVNKNVARYISTLDAAHEINKSQKGQKVVMQLKATAIFPQKLMEKISELEGTVPLVKTAELYANFLNGNSSPNGEIEITMKQLLQEAEQIFKKSQNLHIPILIDGELRNTHYALHAIGLAASVHYNKEKTLIFDTFQCYLKDTLTFLDQYVQSAVQLGSNVGVKLVRGAYMEMERETAKENGQDDPIWETHEKTNEAYDNAVDKMINLCKDQQLSTVIVATMNQNSSQKAAKLMKDLNLKPDHPNIIFAQIYGMSDQLSHSLASEGHLVYKSVPWGSVDEWVPYLARRAAENYSAFLTARNELPSYRRELMNRSMLRNR